MAHRIMEAAFRYQQRERTSMKIKEIKIGSAWKDRETGKKYTVWCVANVGPSTVSEDEHTVVLKEENGFGYYTMTAESFPGHLEVA